MLMRNQVILPLTDTKLSCRAEVASSRFVCVFVITNLSAHRLTWRTGEQRERG